MVCNKQSLWSMYNFPNFTIKEIKALMINNLSKATQLVSVEGRVQTQVCLYLTIRSVSKSTSSQISISSRLLSWVPEPYGCFHHSIVNCLLIIPQPAESQHMQQMNSLSSWSTSSLLCVSRISSWHHHSPEHQVVFYLRFFFTSHMQHFVPLPFTATAIILGQFLIISCFEFYNDYFTCFLGGSL